MIITYIYSATGIKQAKVVINGSSLTTTKYAGNYIYEDNGETEELKFFSHPEGYVEPKDSERFNYVYQYKDHLGNIRVSYSDYDGNGSIDRGTEIVEENNKFKLNIKKDYLYLTTKLLNETEFDKPTQETLALIACTTPRR